MSKYGKYTGNQIEAALNKIGGEEAIDGLLTGAVEVTLKWVKRILATLAFSVTEFIGADWKECAEDSDPRSLDLKEIDWIKVGRETCLNEGEASIAGEEKLRRLKDLGHVRLGGNAFLSLWRDYEANKKNSVLEWMYKTFGVTYIDFFGLVLVDPGGRCVLCLCRHGDGQWDWSCHYLGSDWRDRGFSGVLAN